MHYHFIGRLRSYMGEGLWEITRDNLSLHPEPDKPEKNKVWLHDDIGAVSIAGRCQSEL